MKPTKKSLRAAIDKFDRHRRNGTEIEFYRSYSGGRRPKSWYFVVGERTYPMKAVWAAAHVPSVETREFNTRDARLGLERFGIDYLNEDEAAVREYAEGARQQREATTLRRSATLVAKAKRHYGHVCRACGFDANDIRDEIGTRAIECHHINPLSMREGQDEPTSIKDLVILCANCHRMTHSGKQALTLSELQALVRPIEQNRAGA